ncbi:DUF1269 domain-containing protein [Nocardia sp. ET3-3]|uniref:DUF1269 domain-containing protein n=1 Tax=Nocardia terrae TaxID=2675851 RepID=A0A7K1USM6_9NOCA|nr:DUF1269 domain-containing protein [Nocardia terrae]MVU77169.1 DUF1269 domain-containing protein [Nocardia terrae]
MEENTALITFADDSRINAGINAIELAATNGNLELRSAAVLSRTPDGRFELRDGADDFEGLATVGGGLAGSLVGVLGGPLGVLLGGSLGALTGGVGDAARADESDGAIELFSRYVQPGRTALLIELVEYTPEVLDRAIADLGGWVYREPTVVVEAELQAADEAARAAEKEARKKLREQHKQEFREKREQHKQAFREKKEKLASSFRA